MRLFRSPIFILTILFLVTVATYAGIFSLYYLNDEWRALSSVELYGMGYAARTLPLPYLLLGKGRIVGTFVNEIGYAFFPFSTSYFTITALILHTLNSFLSYLVVNRLFHSRRLAFLTAVFVAVSAGTYETMYWIATELQATLSMFFGLSAVLVSLKFSDSGKKIFVVISAFLTYLAFLTKEASVVFMLFIPAVYWTDIRARNRSTRGLRTILIIIISVAVLAGVLLLRFYGQVVTDAGDPFSPSVFARSIFNIFYYPLVTFPYFIFPDLMNWVRWIFISAGIFTINTWQLSPARILGPDVVALVLSGAVAYWIYGIYMKNKSARMPIALGGIWYFVAFIPVAFHLVTRYESLIEPYLLYYHMFAVGLIGASVCNVLLFRSDGRRQGRPDPLVLYLVLLFIGFQIVSVWYMDTSSRQLGAQARKLTMELLKNRSRLPDYPVVFLTGSRTYGFPNNPLPFWLGGGYIFSVINYPDGKIPIDIVIKQKLSGFGEEGYVAEDKRGFAFFQNKGSLQKFLSVKPSLASSLVAYYWDDNSGTLNDITDILKNEMDRSGKANPATSY